MYLPCGIWAEGRLQGRTLAPASSRCPLCPWAPCLVHGFLAHYPFGLERVWIGIMAEPREGDCPPEVWKPQLLTLALFSMVTASSTRSPMLKVPSESAASPSVSVAVTPGAKGALTQFLLTTLFSCRVRHLHPQDIWVILSRTWVLGAGCWEEGLPRFGFQP